MCFPEKRIDKSLLMLLPTSRFRNRWSNSKRTLKKLKIKKMEDVILKGVIKAEIIFNNLIAELSF
jgi:hypothetical protein